MAKTRTFELGDILSVTTGRLVSRRHMDGIYDILSFMVGHDVFTHEIPSADNRCRPVLLAQFPQLAEINDRAELFAQVVTKPEEWEVWLNAMEEEFGKEFEVKALEDGGERTESPLSTLVKAMGKGREKSIIVVNTD